MAPIVRRAGLHWAEAPAGRLCKVPIRTVAPQPVWHTGGPTRSTTLLHNSSSSGRHWSRLIYKATILEGCTLRLSMTMFGTCSAAHVGEQEDEVVPGFGPRRYSQPHTLQQMVEHLVRLLLKLRGLKLSTLELSGLMGGENMLERGGLRGISLASLKGGSCQGTNSCRPLRRKLRSVYSAVRAASFPGTLALWPSSFLKAIHVMFLLSLQIMGFHDKPHAEHSLETQARQPLALALPFCTAVTQ